MNVTDSIKTIIPADGWLCKYKNHDDKTDTYYLRMACWALKKEDGEDSVVGMVNGGKYGGIEQADESQDFIGYVHEKDIKEPFTVSMVDWD